MITVSKIDSAFARNTKLLMELTKADELTSNCDANEGYK